MAQHAEAVTSGLWTVDGRLLPLEVVLDKRGLGFPMLMMPLHALFGFQPAHALWLNLLGCAACVLLMVRLLRPRIAARAWLAPLILLSFPLVLVTMRTGTFDTVNLALLLLGILLLRRALGTQEPRDQIALVLCAAMLAQMRYEAILPAVGAICALALYQVLRPSGRRLHWIIAVVDIPAMRGHRSGAWEATVPGHGRPVASAWLSVGVAV